MNCLREEGKSLYVISVTAVVKVELPIFQKGGVVSSSTSVLKLG